MHPGDQHQRVVVVRLDILAGDIGQELLVSEALTIDDQAESLVILVALPKTLGAQEDAKRRARLPGLGPTNNAGSRYVPGL